MATTTIQISTGLLTELKHRKMYDKESNEEVIQDMLENTMELSEETKQHIAQAEKEFAKGKFYTHEQVKKGLGL